MGGWKGRVNTRAHKMLRCPFESKRYVVNLHCEGASCVCAC